MPPLARVIADTAAASGYDTSSGGFLAVAVLGTIAFSISGVLAAAEADMDWLGAIVLGSVVAVGGGTIRDILLGRLPVAWMVDEWPVIVSIVTSLVCLAALRLRPSLDLGRRAWFVAIDAVGLAAFVVLGASIADADGRSAFVVVLMGVVTGVGGGILRDVFAGRRPIVFVGEIYAVAGIIGALVFVALDAAGVSTGVVVWVPTALVIVIRALAVRLDLHLPKASPARSGGS